MVDLMALPPGLYRGVVTGEESGDCQCRIEVRRLTEHAMSLDYEAVGVAGLQHVEHTIVTASGLHVAASELPDVIPFRKVAAGHMRTSCVHHPRLTTGSEAGTSGRVPTRA